MGKYLKKFDTHSQYSTYIGGNDVFYPNVSYCVDNNECHYNVPPPKVKITFTLSEATNERISGGGSGLDMLGLLPDSAYVDGLTNVSKIKIDGEFIDMENDLTKQNIVNMMGIVIDEYVYGFDSGGTHTIEYWLNTPNVGSLMCAILGSSNYQGMLSFDSKMSNAEVELSGIDKLDAGSFVMSTAIVSINGNFNEIGQGAFYGCTGLTSITIPDSVTEIGAGAFRECTGLTSVMISNGITSIANSAFGNCTSLTSIIIPNSVTTIDELAFYGCSSLASITIPNSVTTIGWMAFEDCTSLPVVNDIIYADTFAIEAVDKTKTTYTLKEGTRFIGIDCFRECYSLTSLNSNVSGECIIPNTVISIGSYAFYACKGFTSITISDSISTISYGAFMNCDGLTSITIPNSVTSIDGQAFLGCSGLTGTLTIPNSVTTIGSGAFKYCSGLTGTLTIPYSVTTIGEYAFSRCSGLTSITVDSNNTTYDSRNNCNAIIETATNTLIAGCQNTIIPNSITSIANGAFTYCYGLTSVSIPSGVTSIGNEAFEGCGGLTGTLTIPNSVTSIGNWAFAYCDSLTSVPIGNGVTSIGNEAFYYCTHLTSVTVEATTPPTLGGSAFESTNSCPMYVPSSSVDTYKAASGWSDYASRIQAIS